MRKSGRFFTAVLAMAGVLALASCQQSSGSGSEAAAPSITSFTADASFSSDGKQQVTLRWDVTDTAAKYALYKEDVTNTLTELTVDLSKKYCYDSDVTPNDEKTYTYMLMLIDADDTVCCSKQVSVWVPTDTEQSPDWLFLFYADGDNNLCPNIWRNVQQCCTGLQNKTGSKSVKVAVLWDGSAKGSEMYKMIPPSSYLLELGAEDLSGVYYSNTLKYTDYSYTASWLTDSDGNQEVDMADWATATRFLQWAQGRYNAKHTVFLMSDHGSGPWTDLTSSRSVCADNTSDAAHDMIQTTQFSEMFKNAGYNKLDMIVLDACLESSLENAYAVKDYADYFLASPESIPGYGMEYEVFVDSMSSADSALSVGCEQIANYHTRYTWIGEKWQDTLKNYSGKWKKSRSDELTADTIQYTDLDTRACTLTLMKLNGIDAVCSAVNDLAAEINKDPELRKTILEGYLKSTSPIGNTLMHDANFLTYDTGWFAYKVRSYADTNKLTVISDKAKAVEDALEKAILCAWRGGYKPGATVDDNATDYSYYSSPSYGTVTAFSKQCLSADTIGSWFGISIAGGYCDSNYSYGMNISSTDAADKSNTYIPRYANMDMSQAYPAWNEMISHLGDK